MTLLLAQTAIPSVSGPSDSGTHIFTMTAGDGTGFLRTWYGSISPDQDYYAEGIKLQGLGTRSNSGNPYLILMLQGDWLQKNVISLNVDGTFSGSPPPLLLGNDATFTNATNKFWRWYEGSEMVIGNTYTCTLVWDKTN